jgi:hypothetical protein
MLADKEKMELLNPFRYLAAGTIAIGGMMHGIGLCSLIRDNQDISLSVWAVFLFAVCAYTTSAILILKNNMIGYLISFLSPLSGGLFLLMGYIFCPDLSFLKLLPGVRNNQILLVGFITIITEPVACICSMILIKNRIWKIKSS